ncbi:hypothetical protein [Krasilnikovia sp. MM14-A1004]|uniref:hypothetical protein n=1 Tax=Krasilnikovia sp. MM14-A1004 TaxID=3373541 RepID=UPI00399CEFB2
MTLVSASAALVLLGAGACGTDSPAVCDSLDQVQNSIDHVKDTNVSENGLTQLKTNLQALQTELQRLKTDAKSQFTAQLTAVQTAADQLKASVASAKTTPSAATLGNVRTAVAGLGTSLQQLGDSMAGTC